MCWIRLNYCCDHCGGDLEAFDLFGDGRVYDDAKVVCNDCEREGAIEVGEGEGYRVCGISDEDREVLQFNKQTKK